MADPARSLPPISHDTAFAAMCIMEEIVDTAMPDAGAPWAAFREANGINELRTLVLERLAEACDQAWTRAYKRFEEADAVYRERVARAELDVGLPPQEPGSFDYEFVPFWLRNCVDWDADSSPRVRGNAQQQTTVL